jgi:integrase/recombinase XerD
MRTRDWAVALRNLDKVESNPGSYAAPSQTIEGAVKSYLADCRARGLADGTITSYKKAVVSFQDYCLSRDIREMRALRLEDFQKFRASRDVGIRTQRKEIEHLRSFCSFCVEHEWIKRNFAKAVKPPSEEGPTTLPFEPEEVAALLAACDQIENNYRESAARARVRARALVLLLLYSGLRISDCIRMKREKLRTDGRLLIRTLKNGVNVYLKLHDDCIEALSQLPRESPIYFFWSGRGKLASATGSARRTIDCLGRLAGINAHPHRFRDTFSVELLLAGEDIRTVQLLLGHKSIKTTEKHYSPFVKRQQDKLDLAVSKLHFGSRVSREPSLPRRGGFAAESSSAFGS